MRTTQNPCFGGKTWRMRIRYSALSASDCNETSSATAPSTSIMASPFMCNVSLPPKLAVYSGNFSKEWRQWRQVWDAYEEVTDFRNKTSRLRVATFITCIGKEALEIHNGLPLSSGEEKSDLTKVLELWETHCIGKTNIIYENYKFHNRSQEQTESIDTYVTAFQALAETCEFGTLRDHLIRDRIVCGHERNRAKCPAYDQICFSCGKLNHFAVKWGNKSEKPSQKSKPRKVHQLAESDDPSYSSEEEILSVSSQNVVNTVEMSEFKSKIFAYFAIEDLLVKMQVDPGASCNVLPQKFRPRGTVVDTTEVELTTYSKANLKVQGVAKIQLRNPKNQKKYRVPFVVIDEDYTPLLGATSAQQIGLITVQHENILNVTETVVKSACQGLTMEEVTASYSDVFKCLGCMEGALHREVAPAIRTVAHAIMPPRRMPLTLKDRLKDELTRLEKASVIVKDEEPTDWVSSLVVTE
ncbi:hypothetical protein AWC38_SpisGene11661 [Stylophora pistillata]|uniref:Retrotransposon gag domain-containing protein n=1 Tax=Stylophora pistillata TaxID=50429 RepID=A0A2B4S3Z2_STYPI|nr:hypothetical protein AWC38_SpisGene11661 [Stylophora pistillata]